MVQCFSPVVYRYSIESLEVKCPKCRLRYDADVPDKASTVTCVCPRCGTPFLFRIDRTPAGDDLPASADETEDESEEDGVALQSDGDPTEDVLRREGWGDEFLRRQRHERRRIASRRRRRRRRLLLVLSVAVTAFVLFFVANIIGGGNDYDDSDRGKRTESLSDTAAIGRAESPLEPVPEWVKGSWKRQTRFYDIFLDVTESTITERIGDRSISGTYECRGGAIIASFGDTVRFSYKIDRDVRAIDCGDGLIMTKIR